MYIDIVDDFFCDGRASSCKSEDVVGFCWYADVEWLSPFELVVVSLTINSRAMKSYLDFFLLPGHFDTSG